MYCGITDAPDAAGAFPAAGSCAAAVLLLLLLLAKPLQ
jgi:hypothetical protein